LMGSCINCVNELKVLKLRVPMVPIDR